ncbi:MAG: copper amine oxidase N-terminal domain-containing protein [Clostridiales bacterium]|nr:copper amine oxidase N-terminal domain-containing protein [Clostridiales bacterium]
MRKSAALFAVLFAISFAVPTAAKEGISILIDDVPLVTEQPPVIINDRTLVPMRAIFEALGAEMIWDDSTKTVTAVDLNNQVYSFTIGSMELLVNGTDKKKMDVAPQIIDGRTMVPLRAVGEVFGYEVGWNAEHMTVTIDTKPQKENTAKEPEKENNEEKSTVFQGQKDTQVIEKSIAKIRTSHLDGTTQTVDDLVKKLCPKERKWYGVKDDAGYLYVNFEGTTETKNILMQFSIFRDGSVKLTACQAGGAAVSPEAFVETFFQ